MSFTSRGVRSGTSGLRFEGVRGDGPSADALARLCGSRSRWEARDRRDAGLSPECRTAGLRDRADAGSRTPIAASRDHGRPRRVGRYRCPSGSLPGNGEGARAPAAIAAARESDSSVRGLKTARRANEATRRRAPTVSPPGFRGRATHESCRRPAGVDGGCRLPSTERSASQCSLRSRRGPLLPFIVLTYESTMAAL